MTSDSSEDLYLRICLHGCQGCSSGGSLWLRQQWPMGKIIAVHPGQDGKVRVATVKTAGGIFKGPIAKLVLLLQEEDKETILFWESCLSLQFELQNQ